jgi:hypothetical protein
MGINDLGQEDPQPKDLSVNKKSYFTRLVNLKIPVELIKESNIKTRISEKN